MSMPAGVCAARVSVACIADKSELRDLHKQHLCVRQAVLRDSARMPSHACM